MGRIGCNLIIGWMVATSAHMPFPICDGDNVGKISHVRDVSAYIVFDDVDFVLLGCDEPDDPDDAPVDVDPEDGEFLSRPSDCCLRFGLLATPWWCHGILSDPILVGNVTRLRTTARSSFPNISLASAFLSPSSAVRQSALATMCC